MPPLAVGKLLVLACGRSVADPREAFRIESRDGYDPHRFFDRRRSGPVDPAACEMKIPCIRLEAVRNGKILADAPAIPEHVDAAGPLFLRRPHMMRLRPWRPPDAAICARVGAPVGKSQVGVNPIAERPAPKRIVPIPQVVRPSCTHLDLEAMILKSPCQAARRLSHSWCRQRSGPFPGRA